MLKILTPSFMVPKSMSSEVENIEIKRKSSRKYTLIIGVYLLFSCLPTSHTTVRAVPHTAVPILGAIRDMNP